MTFALIVLDGWGIAKPSKTNAVSLARTPNFDKLWKNNPHCTLKASGEAVGLPKGFIGGSEVGHLHLGTGRLVTQSMVRISKAIKNKSFFRNPAFKKAKRVHIIGLASDAGVHSHISHLKALLKIHPHAFVHAFLDGRDTPPRSAARFLKTIPVDSICGRYYAMDRDKRWDRTRLAMSMLTKGKGFTAKTWRSALNAAYKRGENDEFVKPTIINPEARIRKGDTVIFFNYRADRARQLTQKLISFGAKVVSMTKYHSKLKTRAAFPPLKLKNTLGEVISKKLKQLRIAETEKYAHVTFFFNGWRQRPFKNEHRKMIPSPKIATYDLKPAMHAKKVGDFLVKNSNKYDFVLCNFANPDLVGHSGKIAPTVKAVEAVDRQLGRVLQALRGEAIVLADHGNAECMRVKGKPCTAHTTNLVPCVYVGEKKLKLKNGCLYNVAPTILKLMGIKKPREMGASLLA